MVEVGAESADGGADEAEVEGACLVEFVGLRGREEGQQEVADVFVGEGCGRCRV